MVLLLQIFSGVALNFSLLAPIVSSQIVSEALKANALTIHASPDLKTSYIGEIIGYSYVKISIESTVNSASNTSGIVPLKGTFFEAVTGKSFKIIGSYNPESLIWTFNCFNQNHTIYSIFIGKENIEGNIEGTWKQKNTIRKFYLKKQ